MFTTAYISLVFYSYLSNEKKNEDLVEVVG